MNKYIIPDNKSKSHGRTRHEEKEKLDTKEPEGDPSILFKNSVIVLHPRPPSSPPLAGSRTCSGRAEDHRRHFDSCSRSPLMCGTGRRPRAVRRRPLEVGQTFNRQPVALLLPMKRMGYWAFFYVTGFD
ncbi:Hypothetical protein SMAX5B_014385 [Scophthalmus maximus]|uniref:Uncharacterized protein n=1 Tax=Scophthalmus maximus TaxID=52904 RepID=A0A2U9BHW2_SCOMX|nr:Hypothetical protein SMAX5B_014385 [Scophthalmus maximus]